MQNILNRDYSKKKDEREFIGSMDLVSIVSQAVGVPIPYN